MTRNPGNRRPRTIISPEERAAREAVKEDKRRAVLAERVADAALLSRLVPGADYHAPALSTIMNNGIRTSNRDMLMEPVIISSELLILARNVLLQRIKDVSGQHQKTMAAESEANVATTKSATLLLQSAIRRINTEIPFYE